ncbi:MAG TPA: aa3-type cytochrome c oxidase subunit IV [Allosphingosinicella sp.]|nr:aa3-type cytochrome c oxidase subunit IV [Allosphingosinicella sp.]
MAAEGEIDREVRRHQNSYGLFVALMKWGAIVSVITALIVIFVIRA